tara:strand:- start:828 stop:1706 length:879 start_codon:yes stop_codon:yes gene_type:complete
MLKLVLRKLPMVRQFLDANKNLKLLLNECVTSKRIQQEKAVEQLKANSRYDDSRCLVRHEVQFFSQNGEDGIIAEIFRRIGITDQIFLEIGLGNGLESNTALLLQQGWSGWWVEASEHGCREAKEIFAGPLSSGRLHVIQDFVKAETVEALLQKHKVPQEFDLLSLDIDLNTYHAWAALSNFRPRVAVIEYNGLVPPSMDYKVPYAPNDQWDGSGQLGAGLKSCELLGNRLGYRLVGCELTGVNAFFVREDLVDDHFLAPFTAERHFEPLRLHLLRNPPYFRKFNWDSTSSK